MLVLSRGSRLPRELATEQERFDGEWVNIPDPARKGKGEVTGCLVGSYHFLAIYPQIILVTYWLYEVSTRQTLPRCSPGNSRRLSRRSCQGFPEALSPESLQRCHGRGPDGRVRSRRWAAVTFLRVSREAEPTLIEKDTGHRMQPEARLWNVLWASWHQSSSTRMLMSSSSPSDGPHPRSHSGESHQEEVRHPYRHPQRK